MDSGGTMNLEEVKQEVAKMTLMDDVFFQKVADDNDVCAEMLRVLMGDKNLTVIEHTVQYDLKNLQGRSVRLDAHCLMSDGRHVNIEVQKANNCNHCKRVRYNGACLTVNTTKVGATFDDVPDVCVIYISAFDIFGAGKTIYHAGTYVQETGKRIDNGLQEIYVNTVNNDGTEVARLMEVFNSESISNLLQYRYPYIADRVKYFKEDEEGLRIMGEFAKKFYDQGVEEGMEKGRIEGMEKGRIEGMEIGIEKERVEGIKKLIVAMRSAGLDDDYIKRQLVKAYGLTEQEASEYIMKVDGGVSRVEGGMTELEHLAEVAIQDLKEQPTEV